MVYLLPHGGDMLSFQRPCRFARLRTGARAGNQQVAAVLKIERGETGIVAIAERTHALVRRDALRRPEIERDAIEQLLIVADVRVTQRVDALTRRRIERCGDAGGWIGADVLVGRGSWSPPRSSSVTASASRTTRASPVALARASRRQHANPRFEAQRAGHRTAVGGGSRRRRR